MSIPLWEYLKEAETAVAQQETTVAEAKARFLGEQTRLAELGQLRKVVQVLLSAYWNNPDPGKYWDFYSFLDRNGKWAVVRELLPEGTRIYDDWDKWQTRGTTSMEHMITSGVSPRYPVIASSDVLTVPCPDCGEDCPLIEHYVQITWDPTGSTREEWRTRRLVLCMSCKRLTPIEVKLSDNRIQ